MIMNFEEIVDKMEVRKRYEALYWAGALIWAGLVFGAESLGILPQFGQADAWTWLFVGVGLYGTLMNIYGTVTPDLDITTTGDYLWSGFWLLIGVSGFFAVDVFWPVVLVLLGVAIVAKQFVRQNSTRLTG
jgi:hypothetical protein